MRTLIANRYGDVLGEIEPYVTSVPWRLNKVAKVPISLPKSQADADLLKFGNLIIFLFDNGLPVWSGPISAPRSWNQNTVDFDAYSAEQLLKYRVTGSNVVFENKTVGEIFTSLVNTANAIYPTQITLDNIWLGGNTFNRDYHLQSILDITADDLIGKLSTADFDVKPAFDYTNNIVTFTTNLYERRGTKKPEIALMENHNVLDATRKEQGPIVNKWHGAGAGTNWSERPVTAVQDTSSISDYDLLEDSKIYGDITELSTLQTALQNKLEQTKQPVDRWKIIVDNIKPGLLKDYIVGDSIQLNAPTYGFEPYLGLVRILSREHNPQTNHTTLIADHEEYL